jgi:hypothetical protein
MHARLNGSNLLLPGNPRCKQRDKDVDGKYGHP